MKYIAFEGTFNEQIWDSETRTIIWPNISKGRMIKVENVGIQKKTKTWEKVKEEEK